MYIHTMYLYVLCIFNILYYVYYTCMSPLIQDGIITTLNTRVSILAAANPLYRDLTVRGSHDNH